MPLEDGYKTERDLNEDAETIADSIGSYFRDTGKNRGFILYIVDYNTGVVQYISDVERDSAMSMLKHWIGRNDNVS